MLDSDLEWDSLRVDHVASWLSRLPFASALVSEQHRVVWIHPLCEAALCGGSRSVGDTVGNPIEELAHETVQNQLREVLSRAFASDAILELEGPTKGDETRWHLTRIAALPPLADGRFALLQCFDVTARRGAVASDEQASAERDRLAEKLHQGQKMETMGQIATAVAQDFKNVIVSAQGQVDFAKNAVARGANPSEKLEAVSALLARAAELTERLLALGGNQSHRPRPLPLGPFVSATTDVLRRLIPESIGIEVRDQVGDALVLADGSQLEQVLVNLCINARDSIGENGGTITVVVDRQNLPPGLAVGNLDESYVTVSVSDTGAGMHPATLARVFEPFFSTRPDEDRTGLGLPIVQSIIARHGGYVDVRSEPGRGARFTLFLPESRASLFPPLLQTAEPLETQSERVVLLAEDEPTVRKIVTRILSNAGYRVIAAADGLEAVELLRQHVHEVTVAMLDAVMPNLGGKDAYEQMQKLRPNLPVLFSSGYAADSLPQSLLERHNVALLPKPYDPTSLLSTLAALLAKVGQPPVPRDALREKRP